MVPLLASEVFPPVDFSMHMHTIPTSPLVFRENVLLPLHNVALPVTSLFDCYLMKGVSAGVT